LTGPSLRFDGKLFLIQRWVRWYVAGEVRL
jgi:hypothetical protein